MKILCTLFLAAFTSVVISAQSVPHYPPIMAESVTTGIVYGPAALLPADQACTTGVYWIAPIAGSTNAWRQCTNGTLSTMGGIVNASTIPVLVTDPPYNAKCDAQPTTDDGPAINAALSSGASVVLLPLSTAADQQQCTVTTTINIPPNVYLSGQGTILNYRGSTVGIYAAQGAGPVFAKNYIQNLILDETGATGTPKGIWAALTELDNVSVLNEPVGSYSLYIAPDIPSAPDAGLDLTLNDVYYYGAAYIHSESVSGSRLEGFGVNNGALPILTLDSTGPVALDFFIAYGATAAIKITDSLAAAIHPVLSIANGYTTNQPIFDNDAGNIMSISASFYGGSTVFSAPTNFQGSVSVQDSTTNKVTTYTNTVAASTGLLTNPEHDLGTVTTAVTIDPANGMMQKMTQTAGTTTALTFVQPTGTYTGTVQIRVTAPATGTAQFSGCYWSQGPGAGFTTTPPTITATGSTWFFIKAYFDHYNVSCAVL